MITHTPTPRIISSGFVPDDDTRRNDAAHAPEAARIAARQAEIELNARRYLALREHGVIADLKQDAEWLFAGQLDAAADRLLGDQKCV